MLLLVLLWPEPHKNNTINIRTMISVKIENTSRPNEEREKKKINKIKRSLCVDGESKDVYENVLIHTPSIIIMMKIYVVINIVISGYVYVKQGAEYLFIASNFLSLSLSHTFCSVLHSLHVYICLSISIYMCSE